MDQVESCANANVNRQMIEEMELYPRLLLLHLLSSFRGDNVERQSDESATKSSLDEQRRDFLNGISYLCDIEKGGGTVTAAPLQKLTFSNFLWLAANQGVSLHIERFIRFVLDELKDMNSHNRESKEMMIFHDAVNLASRRMQFYRTTMAIFSQECQKPLNEMVFDVQGERFLVDSAKKN